MTICKVVLGRGRNGEWICSLLDSLVFLSLGNALRVWYYQTLCLYGNSLISVFRYLILHSALGEVMLSLEG